MTDYSPHSQNLPYVCVCVRVCMHETRRGSNRCLVVGLMYVIAQIQVGRYAQNELIECDMLSPTDKNTGDLDVNKNSSLAA